MKYIKELYVNTDSDPIKWKEHVNVKTLQDNSELIGGDVLDVGCHHGATTYWLKDFSVKSITGIDVNEEVLELARNNFKEVVIPSEFIAMDLTENSLNKKLNKKFDTIVSFHTLEHIYPEDVDVFIKNIYKMLNVGGNFIISIPYEKAYDNTDTVHHVAYYNEVSLNGVMERNKFTLIKSFKDDRWNEKNILTGIYKK
jgi:2-polyprenyl-3-methyl-5-hydroxy-6-metoxy-1,4-benzoquinol methylase